MNKNTYAMIKTELETNHFNFLKIEKRIEKYINKPGRMGITVNLDIGDIAGFEIMPDGEWLPPTENFEMRIELNEFVTKLNEIAGVNEVPKMNTAITTQPTAALKNVQALPITIDTIRQNICKDASDQELSLFIEICRAHELNPFIDEIYLIKYPGSPATTVVGKGVFMERAFNNPQFDGFEAGIILVSEKGELIRREGAFRMDSETLVGGFAKVYMKNKSKPYVGEVRLQDYIKLKKDGSPSKFWATIPETMIRKVALTQTLKEAMPAEFNRLYDEGSLIDVTPVD